MIWFFFFENIGIWRYPFSSKHCVHCDFYEQSPVMFCFQCIINHFLISPHFPDFQFFSLQAMSHISRRLILLKLSWDHIIILETFCVLHSPYSWSGYCTWHSTVVVNHLFLTSAAISSPISNPTVYSFWSFSPSWIPHNLSLVGRMLAVRWNFFQWTNSLHTMCMKTLADSLARASGVGRGMVRVD